MNSRTRLLAAPLLELGPQDGPGVILGISLGDRVNGLGLCSTCPRHDIVPSRWAPTAVLHAVRRVTIRGAYWGMPGSPRPAQKPGTMIIRHGVRRLGAARVVAALEVWRRQDLFRPRGGLLRGVRAVIGRGLRHPVLFLKRSPCHAQRTQPEDSGSPLRPAERPVILRGVSATAGPRGRCIARKILVDMRIAAY